MNSQKPKEVEKLIKKNYCKRTSHLADNLIDEQTNSSEKSLDLHRLEIQILS